MQQIYYVHNVVQMQLISYIHNVVQFTTDLLYTQRIKQRCAYATIILYRLPVNSSHDQLVTCDELTF